jgi:uracil permease
VQFGVPAPDEVIALMQAGIICTGFLNVIVGLLIKRVGKAKLDRVLPPIVTGSVACVIGIGLAKAALDMSLTVVPGYWGIALVTLLSTIAFSYLLQGRGFIGMLPILLGAVVGYVLTLVVAPDQISFARVAAAPVIAMPHLTAPSFSGPLLLTAIFSISIMALATIPESTAHLYQISLYADRLAEEQGREKYHLDQHVGFNLILDGIGDVLHGLFGATAGTNYGENNSLMAITRNYSGPALIAAGVICILLAFVGKLSAFVATIPVFVSGGLAIYLFGVIGMQGIALMQENKVNLFDPLQLAVGASIMVIGIGGNIGFEGGFLPIKIPGVFPQGLPAIATSAVVGIVLYVVFSALRKEPVRRDTASVAPIP